MRLIVFAFLLTSFSYPVFADVPVITSITGASGSVIPTATTGTDAGAIIVYGGTAGSCTGDGISPCNSCTSSLVACNAARIYNTLVLRIAATHTDPGNLIAVNAETTSTAVPQQGFAPDSVGMLWSDVCSAVLGGTCDATTDKTGTIKICLDKDNSNTFTSGDECTDVQIQLLQVPTTTYDVFGAPTSEGIGGFAPYPGDEKVYITDPQTSTGFPTLGYGGKVKGVRVFIGRQNMTNAVSGGADSFEPVTLPVIEDGATLDDNVVDGLENNVRYFFRVAMVDEASNVVQFFPPAGTQDCDTGGTNCTYAATPDEVLGLLTEDMNCFIASAAYGSSLEPKLNTFREFRFKRLLPTAWGRKFVTAYYHYGPYAARFISDKPALRAVTRGFLWPLYGFSLLSLRFGLWPAFFLSLLALTFLVALPLYMIGVRSSSRRA